jgi:hypothetical protein
MTKKADEPPAHTERPAGALINKGAAMTGERQGLGCSIVQVRLDFRGVPGYG